MQGHPAGWARVTRREHLTGMLPGGRKNRCSLTSMRQRRTSKSMTTPGEASGPTQELGFVGFTQSVCPAAQLGRGALHLRFAARQREPHGKSESLRRAQRETPTVARVGGGVYTLGSECAAFGRA